MKKESMKATKLRNFLIFSVALMVLLIGGGFYLRLQTIRQVALHTSHLVADANASGGALTSLQQLQSQLAERQSLIAKANQLFSTPEAYQAQVLKDIQTYAGAGGITISDYSFDAAATGQSIPGVSTQTMQLTIESPVSYRGLLQFLDAIEGNLPKLQVRSITLTRPNPLNASQVRVDPITIEVFTR